MIANANHVQDSIATLVLAGGIEVIINVCEEQKEFYMRERFFARMRPISMLTKRIVHMSYQVSDIDFHI